MKYELRTYPALLRVAWSNMFQYRVEMMIWAVWGMVYPLVALAVWSAASKDRTIAGLDQADFAAYFLLLMIFSHITMSWDIYEFQYLVQSGRLSAKLLRPIHPIHEAVAANISFKFLALILLVPVWLLILFTLHPRIQPQWWQVAGLAPALMLGIALRFISNYALALLAFWTTKIESIDQVHWSIDQFLGGRLAPLSVMPLFIQTIAWYAPFRWIVVFPVELAMGHMSERQFLEGILMQLIWLVISYGVFRLMWAIGIRRYSAVGA